MALLTLIVICDKRLPTLRRTDYSSDRWLLQIRLEATQLRYAVAQVLRYFFFFLFSLRPESRAFRMRRLTESLINQCVLPKQFFRPVQGIL